MHLNYIKDGDGNTVAVQIPYPDYLKLEPLLKLIDSEVDEERIELKYDNARLSAMQRFLDLHNTTLESKLPDLRVFLNEDRAEFY